MALPHITMTGNLTADPELRFTQAGKPVVNFRIAATDRKKDEAGNWTDGDKVFISVVSWWNAETIANSLKKGQSVTVLGTLKQRDYETNGEKRTSYEVTADTVSAVIRDQHTAGNTATTQATPVNDPWAGTNINAQLIEDTPF